MPFIPELKVQALSKREASQLVPSDRTLLISIQDGDKACLPFKQRTNHITRDRYVATLFCYFDDIQTANGLNYPFAINTNDAKQIINFLNHHFDKPESFDRVIIHCQAGVSRSQAVALFVAKHYYKDEALYTQLLNQEGKVHGGNHYVYNLLEETLANQKS